MKAMHIIDADGRIANTINVNDPADFPNLHLEDATVGQIGDMWNGGAPIQPLPDLSAVKADLSAKIEAMVLAVYSKPVTLAREYERRQSDAQTFKDAGYTGTPGDYLKAFADSAGMDYESAADRVLSQAAAFLQAEPVLAAQRMRKYEIQRAATVDDANTIFAQVQTAVAGVVAQIG